MILDIRYLNEEARGQLLASEDFSRAAWNRIRDLVIGVQADADMGARTITADWGTILTIAPGLSELRTEFAFETRYDDAAREHLLRYRDEVRAVRAAAGRHTIEISEADIPRRLRALGFTRRILTPQQLRDLARVIALRNAANFSVPGAGKTTVALAAHLLTHDEDTRLLVIAPKNAFGAWDEAVTDCLDPSLASEWKFERLSGGYEAIRDVLNSPPNRMIISYDQLIRVRDLIRMMLSVHKVHVILDESHRMKAGDRSQRGMAALRVAHLPVRRDILSGTPIPRSIEDISPQLDFLWPGQGLGWRVVASERPSDVLRGLYVRTTKHELGLPPIHREFIGVRMSGPQMALYGIIRQEVLKKLAGIRTNSTVDLISAKRSVMRLLQVSSNPILVVRRLTEDDPDLIRLDDPKVSAIFAAIIEERDSPKLALACELARNLAARGERSVIWTSFTENVERLSELLSDLGATFIHGGVEIGDPSDPSTREGRIQLFHDDASGCRVLVANPAAGSEGISLHRVCHHAIYVDRTYNAAHYLQSVDRIHRLGLPSGIETHIQVLESIAPSVVGAIDFSVRRRLVEKLRTMSDALEDGDLRRLALDEEEGTAPIDYDISLEDLADVIRELEGAAPLPDSDEVF